METRNRLTLMRQEGEWGEGGKKGEGSSQGTCMDDPWTWTTGQGLTVGTGGWVGGAGRAIGKKLGQL